MAKSSTTVLQKCLKKMEKHPDFDIKRFQTFLKKWKTSEYLKKSQLHQSNNFKDECYLDPKIFNTILLEINKSLRSDNFDATLKKIYALYWYYRLKGSKVRFEKFITNVGTVTNGYFLRKALRNANPKLRKNKNIFDSYLKKLDQGIEAIQKVEGVVKETDLLWITWDYDDAENPFGFVHDSKGKMIFDLRKDIIDQLGLSQRYLEDKIYLVTYNFSTITNLLRPTICDAGDNEFFRVSASEFHGYTYPISGISSGKQANKGRPEGVVDAATVYFKDKVKFESI